MAAMTLVTWAPLRPARLWWWSSAPSGPTSTGAASASPTRMARSATTWTVSASILNRTAAPRYRTRSSSAGPAAREARIDPKGIAGRTQAGEAERERLPDAAHRREVQPAGGRLGDVVEVDPGGEAKRVARLIEAAGAGEQRSVDSGRQELAWAVRGS